MSVFFVCDGCGKQAPGYAGQSGWFKPFDWYSRRDKDGEQHACCRDCIEKAAAATGKTAVVLPV